MNPATCVSEVDLKAFALGHLDEDRSEEVAAHLSACARCEETIAGFDDTADSMLQAVREAAVNTEPVQDVGERILQKIINPWSGLTENSSPATTGEWIRDYELLEPLGHGGMGTVYKAVHARLQRPVALKLLPSRRLRDPAAVARFEREMKAIGRLDHPAIVRATDAGESDGTHFIAMDFVAGIDLSKLIKLTGPMNTASACEVIRQAALGLQYAHEQGLIHRDVKPSNLMIEVRRESGNLSDSGKPKAESREDMDHTATSAFRSPLSAFAFHSASSESSARVKLLDLGLALFGAASEAVDELTTVGQLMGTLDYMAPEQADNSHDVDARADVYSLGATLFKLLTGTALYETAERRSPLQKMKALATVDAPSVRTRRPALPVDVAAVVDRMLLRDPAARFQTAAEVAAAVAPFCADSSLVKLAHRAMLLRQSNQKPGISEDAGLLPLSRLSTTDLPTPSPIPLAGRPPGRLITRSVMATLGGLLLLVAGIVIRVKTDTGTLTIECSSDSIPVQIRQGTETVKELTLSAGPNTITLRSGKYEIIVPVEYDSVTIENGVVDISRGSQSLAKVTQQSINLEQPPGITSAAASDELPKSVSSPTIPQSTLADTFAAIEYRNLADRHADLQRQEDEARAVVEEYSLLLSREHPKIVALELKLIQIEKLRNETRQRLDDMQHRLADPIADAAGPVYEGREFNQWIQLSRTERSTEELTKAVDAIGILGRGERDRDAAKAILAVIEQYDFVDPQTQTDAQAKLMITAIRSIRGLNPDESVRAIAEDFSVRKPSVHEFVLSGLLLPLEMIYRGAPPAVTERISLGKTEPLASKLKADEQLAFQMIQVSELNSGVWSPQKYPTFAGNTWFGTDPVFHFISTHVGNEKPSPTVESYLRPFAVDPLKVPKDQQLSWQAVAAAGMLARHSPEEVHARIFLRAIQDGMKTPKTILEGYGGPPKTSLQRQLQAWNGLSLLGKHADPAVPFMLEILSSAPEAGSVLDELSNLSTRTEVTETQSVHQVSIRLFAIEVLASSGTQNVKALEILRAELKLLLGQEPTDGSFEIAPGRISSFLAPETMISLSYPGFSGVHPDGVSPIDIEMTNSCLLAWKALTAAAPRFAEASLGPLTSAERPPESTLEYMPKILPGRQDLQ